MAKSELIKDFARNKLDLESALKQLKLLLIDLNKQELVDWVNYELQGYPENVELPSYRLYGGNLKGTFLNYNTKCSNVPIPLRNDIPEVIKECTEKVHFRESISSLKRLQSADGRVNLSIPGNLLPSIQGCAAVSMTYLMSACIEVSDIAVTEIISTVENKIMDILIALEAEFGVLDSLDIDLSGTKDKDIEKTRQIICNIIYDNHIEIGNNNKIKDSLFNCKYRK